MTIVVVGFSTYLNVWFSSVEAACLTSGSDVIQMCKSGTTSGNILYIDANATIQGNEVCSCTATQSREGQLEIYNIKGSIFSSCSVRVDVFKQMSSQYSNIYSVHCLQDTGYTGSVAANTDVLYNMTGPGTIDACVMMRSFNTGSTITITCSPKIQIATTMATVPTTQVLKTQEPVTQEPITQGQVTEGPTTRVIQELTAHDQITQAHTIQDPVAHTSTSQRQLITTINTDYSSTNRKSTDDTTTGANHSFNYNYVIFHTRSNNNSIQQATDTATRANHSFNYNRVIFHTRSNINSIQQATDNRSENFGLDPGSRRSLQYHTGLIHCDVVQKTYVLREAHQTRTTSIQGLLNIPRRIR
ncbi:uncharacterized protein [Haliotis asinina]|uniref:uncharacterized protein n=1 Tax=Haliotis asinina TaxID=109174 RepID=UPI00353189E0